MQGWEGQTVAEPTTFRTLQEFAEVAGKPWYALQRHSDAGVERQYTGYRDEVDAPTRQLGICYEELPATTEEEFLRRAMGDVTLATHSGRFRSEQGSRRIRAASREVAPRNRTQESREGRRPSSRGKRSKHYGGSINICRNCCGQRSVPRRWM
jgi:hypothetical protein